MNFARFRALTQLSNLNFYSRNTSRNELRPIQGIDTIDLHLNGDTQDKVEMNFARFRALTHRILHLFLFHLFE